MKFAKLPRVFYIFLSIDDCLVYICGNNLYFFMLHITLIAEYYRNPLSFLSKVHQENPSKLNLSKKSLTLLKRLTSSLVIEIFDCGTKYLDDRPIKLPVLI